MIEKIESGIYPRGIEYDRYRYNFSVSNAVNSTLEFSSELILNVAGGLGTSNLVIKDFDFTCHLVDTASSLYLSLNNNHLRVDFFDGAGNLIYISDAGQPTTGNGQIVNIAGSMGASAPLIIAQGHYYQNINRAIAQVGKIRFQWRPFQPTGYTLPATWQFTGYCSVVFDKLN